MKHNLMRRSGSIMPIVAISMTLFFLMLAFGLDLGIVYLSRNELQNAADAAALAGAPQLVDEDFLQGFSDQSDDIEACRNFTETFAGWNTAARRYLRMDRNESNNPTGGIVVGYTEDPFDMSGTLQSDGVSEYNTVRVETKLAEGLNGPLELFAAAVFGEDHLEIKADATAMVDDRLVGFKVKQDEKLSMLPFTVNVDLWDQRFPGDPIGASMFPCLTWQFLRLLAGVSCHWTSDGVLFLYPNWPGEQGNFGTLDIGPSDNSTADLVEQIRYGVSAEDLEAIGGLILTDEDEDGVFAKWLQGDTGVSTAIQSAVNDIKGEPRLIPLHRNYYGSGNNMMYEVVRFAGVRVVNVVMTGALEYRHIDVRPCQIITPDAVVNPSAPGSNLVYTLSLTR
ncbi:MAG: pilus assembly protein TadG-related protein [bacterium]